MVFCIDCLKVECVKFPLRGLEINWWKSCMKLVHILGLQSCMDILESIIIGLICFRIVWISFLRVLIVWSRKERLYHYHWSQPTSINVLLFVGLSICCHVYHVQLRVTNICLYALMHSASGLRFSQWRPRHLRKSGIFCIAKYSLGSDYRLSLGVIGVVNSLEYLQLDALSIKLKLQEFLFNTLKLMVKLRGTFKS